MTVAIKFDACDQNSYYTVDENQLFKEQTSRYPLSNACGQDHGIPYEGHASACELQCVLDPNMEQRATTRATTWANAPDFLKCAPRSKVDLVAFYV
jgi:hypothetical protein